VAKHLQGPDSYIYMIMEYCAGIFYRKRCSVV
jgi:hypothetical protein